jgi:uncharacterized cupin superfamily protein
MKINNIDNLVHSELMSSGNGEIFSKSAVLTDLLGFNDIFVHHEILLPGHKASAPHRHTLREEMAVILVGAPTAYLGDQSFKLKEGDFFGFKPGSMEMHYLVNETSEVVKLLMICSHPADDLTIYK